MADWWGASSGCAPARVLSKKESILFPAFGRVFFVRVERERLPVGVIRSSEPGSEGVWHSSLKAIEPPVLRPSAAPVSPSANAQSAYASFIGGRPRVLWRCAAFDFPRFQDEKAGAELSLNLVEKYLVSQCKKFL
jgi:hypothetical protein